MVYKNVYDFIIAEEQAFKTAKIEVAGGWFWSFYEHVLTTILQKNSQFIKNPGKSRPFKNIVRPILNLQYRAEGFDVKDIEVYVNEVKNYYKSFLIRKLHDKWARENGIDTFIDNLVESFVDYGGALVKRMRGIPEVVPLPRIAFADQTNLLGGAICERHFYSPSELMERAEKYNWDKKNAKLLGEMCELEVKETHASTSSTTPTPYVEIFEVHGNLPKSWLYEKSTSYEDKEYVPQVHICGFWKNLAKDGTYTKNGLSLFYEYEKEPRYKVLLRDEIYGRALGLGGAEELFDPQIWTNYAEIAKKNFLDASSKILYQTADARFHTRNKTMGLESGEILITEPGKPISQINTFPSSFTLFDKAANDWEEHAKFMASAYDPLLGEEAKSGTPFRAQALAVSQGQSIHDYRRGKIATFVEELYREWIMPSLVKEAQKDQEFLVELDMDDLQTIAKQVVDNTINKAIKERILSGELPPAQEEIDALKLMLTQEFTSAGKKRFIEIFKDDFKGAELDVKVNVAGKQKNQTLFVEKLSNIFLTIAKNPAILNDPRLAKILNQMLEASNLDQIDMTPPPNMMPAAQPVGEPTPVPA